MIRRFPTLFCLSAVCLIVLAAMAAPAVAQSFSFDMGDAGGSFTGRIIQLLVLMTVLTLAPSILVVVTSFTQIVVVLSIIRSALGLQQTPPNAVLISLALFLNIADAPPPENAADVPLRILVPSFILSELKRAFEIGFLVFIPFVIIDMVVASVLMSMGMMMLPPVMISLPFKLIFFVLVDGWYLVAGSLVQSYGG